MGRTGQRVARQSAVSSSSLDDEEADLLPPGIFSLPTGSPGDSMEGPQGMVEDRDEDAAPPVVAVAASWSPEGGGGDTSSDSDGSAEEEDGEVLLPSSSSAGTGVETVVEESGNTVEVADGALRNAVSLRVGKWVFSLGLPDNRHLTVQLASDAAAGRPPRVCGFHHLPHQQHPPTLLCTCVCPRSWRGHLLSVGSALRTCLRN